MSDSLNPDTTTFSSTGLETYYTSADQFALEDEEGDLSEENVILLGEGTIKNPFFVNIKKSPFLDLNKERAFMLKLLATLGVDVIYYKDSHVNRRKLRRLDKNNLEN